MESEERNIKKARPRQGESQGWPDGRKAFGMNSREFGNYTDRLKKATEVPIDPAKHYAKIGGSIVEYTRLSYFKDTYPSDGYLGSGGIYISNGNYVEAAMPHNRETMHFWK